MKIGDIVKFDWDGAVVTGIVAQYDPEIGYTIVEEEDPDNKLICFVNKDHSIIKGYTDLIEKGIATGTLVSSSELDYVTSISGFSMFADQSDCAFE